MFIFSSTGCTMQINKLFKSFGTDHKVRCLFVLTQLHILSTAIHLETCKTYFIGSLVSRLVHTSLSQLEPLVTGGQLGQVSSHYFK